MQQHIATTFLLLTFHPEQLQYTYKAKVRESLTVFLIMSRITVAPKVISSSSYFLSSSFLIRRHQRVMGRKSRRGGEGGGGGRRLRVMVSKSSRQPQRCNQFYRIGEWQQYYALLPQQQLVAHFTSTSRKKDSQQQQQQDDDESKTTTHNNHSNDHNHNPSKQQSSSALTHFFEQIQSPPNLITTARIASAPVLCYFVINEQHQAALIGSLLAGLSDAADGYLAKHYNMSTVLGTYLDPLADKILINSLSVSLWYTAVLPGPLVALWLLKDVGLMTATYRHVAAQTRAHHVVMDPFTTPLKINPTQISKINTALQFLTVGVAIFMGNTDIVGAVGGVSGGGVVDTSSWQTNIVVLEPLCWLTGTTTILSAGSYIGYSGFLSSGNENINENDTRQADDSRRKNTTKAAAGAAATTTTTDAAKHETTLSGEKDKDTKESS